MRVARDLLGLQGPCLKEGVSLCKAIILKPNLSPKRHILETLILAPTVALMVRSYGRMRLEFVMAW